MTLVRFALVVAATFGCSDDSSPGAARTGEAQSSAELAAALSAARAGDTVTLAPGTYTGHFSIPPGVTLEGNGATVSGEGLAVFEVTGGEEIATRLRDINIENDGMGVSAVHGVLALEDVNIDVAKERGLLVSDATRVELTRVAVTGPVNDDTITEVGEGIDPDAFAALGIGVSGGEIALTDITVSGFAGFGVILQNVSGSWTGGAVFGNVGTNVLAEASGVTIDSVEIRDSLQTKTAGSFAVGMGLVIVARSSVTTRALSIAGISGSGVLQDDATSTHEALAVRGTGIAGVWVQNVTAAETAISIMGDSAITDNAGLGIHLRSIQGAVLDGVRVSGTTKVMRLIGARPVEIGDGIEAVGLTGLLTLHNTTLEDNERVGLLFDGAGVEAMSDVDIDNWSVKGSGDFGLIVQNSTLDFRPTTIDRALDEQDSLAREAATVLATDTSAPTIPRASVVIGDDIQTGP